MATFAPDHGWLVCVRAQTVANYDKIYDVAATDGPEWAEWFGATADIGIFSYVFKPSSVATTPTIPTKTIELPGGVGGYAFKLQLYNACWTPDYCDMDLEFLDASGAVLAAIRTRWDNAYRHGLWYGPSLASLTKAAQVGSYPQTYGALSFTPTAIVYTTDPGDNKNQSFSIACTTSNIKSMRFSNLKAQESYTGGNGCSAGIHIRIASAPAGFDGNFAALSAEQYTALNPDLLLPSGASLAHQPGVGLVASGTAPSYVLSRGILPGQTGVLLDASNQVVARLSYLNGIASLTVAGLTSTAPCSAPYLMLAAFNGQVFTYYQSQIVTRSALFISTNPSKNWVELQPGESLASIAAVVLFPLAPDLTYWPSLLPFSGPKAANQEPRAQFQPQDVAVRGSPPMYAGPVPAAILPKPKPLVQGRDYYWIRDGVRNVEQGYIESTVTINGEGVARRVLCFTQSGELVGETMSRASDGKYRFDLLWLNRRYMLVAQDEPAFGPADYNAVAADYQQPTAYAPGEGVGLT